MENHYEVACHECGKRFWRHNRQKPEFKAKHDGHNRSHEFCSVACSASNKDQSVSVRCGWCNKEFQQSKAELNKSKSGLSFCNRSCSASHNNTQRRRGRRSKCEKLFFDLMKDRYSDLDLLPNDKTMLDGLEVDVAIPSLNLAIEWNGPVHFKPIFGDEQLMRIQSVDVRKQLLAETKGLRLIVIPDLVSTKTFVNEAFMNVCKIVDELRQT